mmetsp:Transcript_53022/g.154298  ORF Transcript_53022/g.154298 Transcript_53022/m.154298 type:complete len:258 (-) Transcript_53022:143-916(-)
MTSAQSSRWSRCIARAWLRGSSGRTPAWYRWRSAWLKHSSSLCPKCPSRARGVMAYLRTSSEEETTSRTFLRMDCSTEGTFVNLYLLCTLYCDVSVGPKFARRAWFSRGCQAMPFPLRYLSALCSSSLVITSFCTRMPSFGKLCLTLVRCRMKLNVLPPGPKARTMASSFFIPSSSAMLSQSNMSSAFRKPIFGCERPLCRVRTGKRASAASSLSSAASELASFFWGSFFCSISTSRASWMARRKSGESSSLRLGGL